WGIFSAASTKIVEDLADDNFAFSLLLPADHSPLQERIDALCFWCRGYLSGLALIGITQEDLENPVIKELVHDISQIAHVGIETDASEEDESNYVELVE